ncbi:MAG: hypothetical protein FJX11_07545 [Alphaproteobacteria bacterium]|nr:hypothetical protein [Alphaproteobacteria bacterium]MBM3647627.1 hypothetical protein [Alphaproteobacteria bacterium]
MTLRTIRLELARCREFPEGNPRHGYEFIAPLDDQGQFDAIEWKANRKKCTVRHFWTGADETGVLVHGRGNRWAFSYVPDEEEDDESLFRFDRHIFKPGEYISIREHDGELRTFRVASVA